MIKLGEMVRDTLTEQEGLVTQRAERLYSCPICWVEGRDGREHWIEEPRLRVIGSKPVAEVTPINPQAEK